MRESFLMYLSFWEPVKDLPREQKGELLEAIYSFQITGEIMQLSPAVKMAFAFIRSQFVRDGEKYADKCEQAKEAANKRWEKEKFIKPDANAYERIKPDAKHADTVSDAVTVTGSENELILSGDKSPVSAFSFEQFWKIYNKPADRVKCMSKFKKLSAADKELIRERLPAYIASTPDAQFRKNPLTYLNGKCWQDEPAVPEARKCAL